MFDWVNWAIELIIAVFFISGFFTAYYRLRGFMIARQSSNKKWRQAKTATVLTGFVLALGVFCLIAARWDPVNVAGYLNWLLFILVMPLIDEHIGPREFLFRVMVTMGLWYARVNMHTNFALLSLFSLAFLLSLIWRYRNVIAQSNLFRMGVAVWLGTAFWLTQTQLTTLNIMMNIVMFIFINVFTLLYWSSERLNELERARLVMEINEDTLTGAGSYLAFKEHMYTAMGNVRSHDMPLVLAMFDLDRFKSINDRYGHQAGNETLIQVTRAVQLLIKDEAGDAAKLFRTGGEEFNIAFTGMTIADAATICLDVRKLVSLMVVVFDNQEIRPSLSMGVTQMVETDLTLDDIYNRADILLYESKKNGRNRVTFDQSAMNQAAFS